MPTLPPSTTAMRIFRHRFSHPRRMSAENRFVVATRLFSVVISSANAVPKTRANLQRYLAYPVQPGHLETCNTLPIQASPPTAQRDIQP
jgi:hypothetical protein